VTRDRGRKRAIHARMYATWEPYTLAARMVDAEAADTDGACRACKGPSSLGLLCDDCREEGWTITNGRLEIPDDMYDDYDGIGYPEDYDGGFGPNSYFAHVMRKDD
jgi:hypothetical protein